jgi:hypothetical protein
MGLTRAIVATWPIEYEGLFPTPTLGDPGNATQSTRTKDARARKFFGHAPDCLFPERRAVCRNAGRRAKPYAGWYLAAFEQAYPG